MTRRNWQQLATLATKPRKFLNGFGLVSKLPVFQSKTIPCKNSYSVDTLVHRYQSHQNSYMGLTCPGTLATLATVLKSLGSHWQQKRRNWQHFEETGNTTSHACEVTPHG